MQCNEASLSTAKYHYREEQAWKGSWKTRFVMADATVNGAKEFDQAWDRAGRKYQDRINLCSGGTLERNAVNHSRQVDDPHELLIMKEIEKREPEIRADVQNSLTTIQRGIDNLQKENVIQKEIATQLGLSESKVSREVKKIEQTKQERHDFWYATFLGEK